MLAYIKGVLTYKDADVCIIEASGLGYELSMSTQALASLPAIGQTAQVWVSLQVKDDGVSLFGFADPQEKELFTLLTSVSGIGARIAISALSTFKPQELAACITAGDITSISSVPGIGKKTAQRMVLELQGALSSDTSALFEQTPQSSQLKDASAALVSMGFSSEEVASALKGCAEQDTSAIIRYALKQLGGGA